MIITAHRKNSINLQLFLENMGFKCFFQHTGEIDDLLVIPDDRIEFLEEVKSYVEQYHHIPYHFCFPVEKGLSDKNDKITFTGDLVGQREFKAVSGDFNLFLFRTEDKNYLWKTYTRKDCPQRAIVTGKPKAIIKSMEGNVINLVSHCRLKEV